MQIIGLYEWVLGAVYFYGPIIKASLELYKLKRKFYDFSGVFKFVSNTHSEKFSEQVTTIVDSWLWWLLGDIAHEVYKLWIFFAVTN